MFSYSKSGFTSSLRLAAMRLVALQVALLAFLILSQAPAVADDIFRRMQENRISEHNMPFMHAVLPVHKDESLYGQHLEAAQLRNLNGLLNLQGPYKPWEDCYSQSEMEACNQISARVHDLSVKQVEELLGLPWARTGSPLCANSSLKDYDQSLYIMGTTPIIVRMLFQKDRCVKTFCAPYDLDDMYCQWRVKDIEKQALGKTENEIINSEGFPSDIAGVILPPTNNKDAIESLTARYATVKVWQYDFGMHRALLAMENGKCIGKPPCGFCMFGFITERTPGATFRLPK